MVTRLLHRIYLFLRKPSGWVRRRFTPAGGYVLGGLVATAGASNPEQTMGFQVFLTLLVMLLIAGMMALFFRMRFAIHRQVPRFVTAGDPFNLRVHVRNLTDRLQRGLEYLEEVQDQPLTVHELEMRLRLRRGQRGSGTVDASPLIRTVRTQPVALPALPANGSVEARLEIVAYRRGPLVLKGGLVARTAPFGLFRGFSRMAAPHTVLVLPRRYPLPPLRLPGQTHYQRGGVAMAASVGESEEFVALREYRRGDALRRVHWRSSARLGELVVKEFQDEYFVRHALVLDTFCGASGDTIFEEAVAVAASFVCTVPDQESLLDLLLVGPRTVCVTSGRGVGHTQQMLEVLAAVQPCRRPHFDDLQALVLEHSSWLSGCLLVLLGWDEPRRALVRRLKALRLPTLVMLMVPRGKADTFDPGPPGDQPDRLLVLESGHVEEGLQRLEAVS